MQLACSSCAAAIPRRERRWSPCLRSWIATCPNCHTQIVCREHLHRADLRVLLDVSAITGRIGGALILFFGASISLAITEVAWLSRVHVQGADHNFLPPPTWLLFETPFILFCCFGAAGVGLASFHLTYLQRFLRWSIVAIMLSFGFMVWFMVTSMASAFVERSIGSVLVGIGLSVIGVALGCALMLDRGWTRKRARFAHRRFREALAR